MTPWMMFIIGIGSFLVAILGAIVAIRKLGPEVNKLQVDTSESLVAMARINAEMHAKDAEDLRQRNQALDDRLTKYATEMGKAMARIDELERTASKVDALTAENARLTTENNRLRRERNQAMVELRDIKDRIAILERVIDRQNQHLTKKPDTPGEAREIFD